MKWYLKIHIKGDGYKFMSTTTPMNVNERTQVEAWHHRSDDVSPVIQLSGNNSTVQIHVDDVAYLEWEEVKSGN